VAGCTSRSDVLAVVGTRTVTVHEFQEVARHNWQQYPGPATSRDARFSKIWCAAICCWRPRTIRACSGTAW